MGFEGFRFGRILHGAVILIVLVVYTMFLAKNLSNTFTKQIKTLVEKEFNANPAMRKDYLLYKRQKLLEGIRKPDRLDYENSPNEIHSSLIRSILRQQENQINSCAASNLQHIEGKQDTNSNREIESELEDLNRKIKDLQEKQTERENLQRQIS